MKKEDVNKIIHLKIGEENECSYLCNPLLKKAKVLQIVLNIIRRTNFEKFKKNFALNTNGPYLCIPNEKRGGSKA